VRHYELNQIRNVVLLSHSGAGKTSLAEAMLFACGAVNRLGSVDDGTATSDYDPEETKRKMSINLSLVPCQWKDTKLNFIDTPGYPDFVGEVKAGLQVSEGAVIMVCAASGVEVGTEQVWDYTDGINLPRLIFINKMERENADFFRTVEQIQSKLGAKCLPIQLPLGSQKNFQGIIDLVTMRSYTGANLQESDIPLALQDQAKSSREKLVEAAIETDDELIAKYLEGAEITTDEIYNAIKRATTMGKVMPILVGSALGNIGIAFLLDAIRNYLPSPEEEGSFTAVNASTNENEKIKPDAKAPLATLVFKTSADPYVGKLSYLRVYCGVLQSNSHVWNVTKGGMERIGQLFTLRGKNQEPTAQLTAGDIGVVTKLALTATGNALGNREHPLAFAPVELPQPILSMAVYPKSKADLDKMSTVLPKLCEEDPTIQTHREADTNEVIISGIGETHLEVTAEKMLRKFGVEVKLELPKVPYKETITVPTKAEYKHKKQTGGHGQYGHVLLELEPLPRGSGFEFVKKIVGGAVPKNYIPAIEKGINEAKQAGVLAKYPVADLRATLCDGSYHPVDSSDIAFKIAATQALKKGLAQAQPILIEPVMNFIIAVPESFTGDIIGDLNTKRARVLGMTPQDGSNIIQAQAPLTEMLRYATDLRSITQGRGTYSMEFDHYEEVPAHISQKIIAEAQAEKD